MTVTLHIVHPSTDDKGKRSLVLYTTEATETPKTFEIKGRSTAAFAYLTRIWKDRMVRACIALSPTAAAFMHLDLMRRREKLMAADHAVLVGKVETAKFFLDDLLASTPTPKLNPGNTRLIHAIADASGRGHIQIKCTLTECTVWENTKQEGPVFELDDGAGFYTFAQTCVTCPECLTTQGDPT
jgi:hypothetical protein